MISRIINIAPSSSSQARKENYSSNDNNRNNNEQPKLNLNNWQREGYPSEYAYAQDKGALNDIQSKDTYENKDFNTDLQIQIPGESANNRLFYRWAVSLYL
jgi:hypothetical protein